MSHYVIPSTNDLYVAARITGFEPDGVDFAGRALRPTFPTEGEAEAYLLGYRDALHPDNIDVIVDDTVDVLMDGVREDGEEQGYADGWQAVAGAVEAWLETGPVGLTSELAQALSALLIDAR